MTTQEIDVQAKLQPVIRSQATEIEATRAYAEVEAAALLAQRFKRDLTESNKAMREACATKELAERAFWRYPRGGKQLTGETIVLAAELARCWGNVQYGISELARDMELGRSEMLAYAWDVETNTRVQSVFFVPHRREVDGKMVALETDRDVYEGNANAGGRRLRQQILKVLPVWFLEEAKRRCRNTIAGTDGKTPLAKRVTDAVVAFDQLGVTADMLAAKFGRAPGEWTEADLANARIVGLAIRNMEATVEAEFPPARVTADEVRAQDVPAEHGKPDPTAPAAGSGPSTGSSTAPPAQSPSPTGGTSLLPTEMIPVGVEHAGEPAPEERRKNGLKWIHAQFGEHGYSGKAKAAQEVRRGVMAILASADEMHPLDLDTLESLDLEQVIRGAKALQQFIADVTDKGQVVHDELAALATAAARDQAESEPS